MLAIKEITRRGTYVFGSNECDPDYWTICPPDVGGCSPSSVCNPEVNMCAPDYGEDGCLPDCSPEND